MLSGPGTPSELASIKITSAASLKSKQKSKIRPITAQIR